ncbi:hypothetical protein [Streptomyces lavendofoliae]|uniref:hypothetical protein n=1 Tax=Streptomyces lavendofoliae TaxID=67314 RepID=UPI00300EF7BB
MTAKSVPAAHVDGELQLTAVTAGNKVVRTIRHADRTWPTVPVALQGVTGTLGIISLTGTLQRPHVAGCAQRRAHRARARGEVTSRIVPAQVRPGRTVVLRTATGR